MLASTLNSCIIQSIRQTRLQSQGKAWHWIEPLTGWKLTLASRPIQNSSSKLLLKLWKYVRRFLYKQLVCHLIKMHFNFFKSKKKVNDLYFPELGTSFLVTFEENIISNIASRNCIDREGHYFLQDGQSSVACKHDPRVAFVPNVFLCSPTTWRTMRDCLGECFFCTPCMWTWRLLLTLDRKRERTAKSRPKFCRPLYTRPRFLGRVFGTWQRSTVCVSSMSLHICQSVKLPEKGWCADERIWKR